MIKRFAGRFGVTFVAAGLSCIASLALACTGITLTGQDGSVVRARTLEWGSFDLKASLDIIPRNISMQATSMPDGKAGMRWTAKYGFVGTAGHGRPLYADGINESGLTAGLFYLPGFAEYKVYDPDYADTSLAPTVVVGFLLAKFSTLDEVR